MRSITPKDNWGGQYLITLVTFLVFDIDPVLHSVIWRGGVWHAGILTIIINATSGKQYDAYFTFDAISRTFFRDGRYSKSIIDRPCAFVNKKNIILASLIFPAQITITIFKPKSDDQGIFHENTLLERIF